MLVFATYRMAFHILPRIYFSCGGLEGNVSVKNTHKNVWAFKWCRVWITANNLKSKMGECLNGTALYRSWMVFHHRHILAKKVTYFKALSKDTSIFSERKRRCGNKRRKMLCYNLLRRWNLSINVRAWDLLLVSFYLRFAFRVWIFLLLVILAGPHFAMSHFLIIINLFCFMLALAHSKFQHN